MTKALIVARGTSPRAIKALIAHYQRLSRKHKAGKIKFFVLNDMQTSGMVPLLKPDLILLISDDIVWLCDKSNEFSLNPRTAKIQMNIHLDPGMMQEIQNTKHFWQGADATVRKYMEQRQAQQEALEEANKKFAIEEERMVICPSLDCPHCIKSFQIRVH